MGYVYKITNKINGKSYIGKTEYSVSKRWQEHIRDSTRNRCKDRPLYKAINFYGIENFTFEILEETNNTSEREIYWITFYSTYSNGYNATKGGDGKARINWLPILSYYKENKDRESISSIAVRFNIDVSSLCNKIKSENLERPINIVRIKFYQNVNKKVICLNNLLEFNSVKEASEYLVNKLGKHCIPKFYASHISACCRGKRKSVLNHFFKYKE